MTTLNARTAEVTLYQGEDRAKLAELEEAVVLAEQKRRASSKANLLLTETPEAEVEAAVKKYNAAVAAAKKRALVVKLSAVPYLAWRRLRAEHPSREGSDEDKLLGQNWDTFPLAVILECWQDDSVPNRAATVEGLCEADFMLLFGAAHSLNVQQGFDPKAVTATDLMRANGETPK